MPRIMTDAYKDATFILPFTEDKSEYALVRPLSYSNLMQLRMDARKEAGADEDLFNSVFTRLFLQKSLTGWQGFYDVAGNEIPFSMDAVRQICEHDTEFAAAQLLRIRNVARFGQLAEEKN